MLLKFVQLFCILSIATAQNINATAPSSGATTLSIGVTTVSSTQAPYSNATTPSGNATTPSTTPASSSNTITQSGGSATPSNATTPSGAVIVSFGGLTTSTSDATTLSSAPTISPTFLLPTTNSPYNQTFDDPLDCFIGEHFESNVQLYHIIGVRNVDARFKISAHDENFGIKSFFHSVLVPKPQFPVTSRPLNSTSVSNGSANSSAKGLPTNGTKKSPTQNVGPTTPLNLKGITASWDAKSNTFHFVIPHEGFRRYK
uniref:Galectin n=1 Tax=Caenorhabditis japonica TaxID=281687 RepID=A0A8R1E2W8_CAEJA